MKHTMIVISLILSGCLDSKSLCIQSGGQWEFVANIPVGWIGEVPIQKDIYECIYRNREAENEKNIYDY